MIKIWLIDNATGQNLATFDSSYIPKIGEKIYLDHESYGFSEKPGDYLVMDIKYFVHKDKLQEVSLYCMYIQNE